MRWDGPVRACGGAVAVIALFRRLVPADSDTPWHVTEGQLLLRHWAGGIWDLGRTDSFSWTARGGDWHPNSWGFDAVLALAYDLGGWAGVALLRVALLAAMAALAWCFSGQSGAGRWARAAAVWISVVLVIPTGAMRSQLASFLLLVAALALTARILEADTGDRRRRAIPLLAGLAATFSLWSMLHGAVIVGVALVGAACVGHAIDVRRWRRSAVVAGVALVASCVSPLGTSVWTYALRTSGESRRQGIQEWQPPSFHRADQIGVVVLLFAIVVVAMVARWRRSDRTTPGWSLIAPALVSSVLACLALRNATFAVLAAVPLLAAHLSGIGDWLTRRDRSIPVRPGPALAAMTIGALMAGAIQTGTLSLDPDPLEAPKYPSVAARALPAGCRLLNEYQFGGYLIFVRPDIPVSQDGRNDLYGTARLADQEDLLADGTPATASAALDGQGITCVLASPGRPLLRALAGDPAWRRVAASGPAQAWVRRP